MDAHEIIEKAEVAAIATDSSNRLLAWNSAADELLDLTRREAKPGDDFYSLIEARDSFGNLLASGASSFFSMIDRGEPVGGFELVVAGLDGERMRLSILPVVVLAGSREDSAIVYLLRSILRRPRADEAIEHLMAVGDVASVDPLGRLVERESRVDKVGLTRRQLEVLRLMAGGGSVEEMAKELGVSVNTARTHVARILRRLNVHSRVQAVALAYREGLL